MQPRIARLQALLAAVDRLGQLFDELARYEFAAYCSGEATRYGGDQVTPALANIPVVVDRVGVMPGQYVFADASGAVVIPDRQIDEVLDGARRVEAEDAGYREEIAHERDPGS